MSNLICSSCGNYRDTPGHELGCPFAIEGSLKISLSSFPSDLLREIIDSRLVPVMSIQIDAIYISDGITLETTDTGATVSFDFKASEIRIKKDGS